jgi:hypothetical protein
MNLAGIFGNGGIALIVALSANMISQPFGGKTINSVFQLPAMATEELRDGGYRAFSFLGVHGFINGFLLM